MRRGCILCVLKAVAISVAALAFASSTHCAGEPIDVVRQLIARANLNSNPDRRALYETLKLTPAEVSAANTILAPDDFSSPTWCLASNVEGDAAVVSVVTLKDNNRLDPDPCYLVRTTNVWHILRDRTDIRGAEGVVTKPTMEALKRLATWYDSHKKALSTDLAREFKQEWTSQKPPSQPELRALQIRVLSKLDPQGPASTGKDPFVPEAIINAALIEELLNQGLSVDTRNTNRFNKDTLLYFAVRNGAKETVKLLLERGATVDAKSSTLGKTALFQAAFDGRVDLAEILVGKGGNVNALDMFSNNALREAILGKRTKTVSFLLEKGANPNQRNTDGETMADIARKSGTPEIKALFK